MTHLLLVRHALNDAVGKGLAGRDPGVHLNAEGKEQAERICEVLKPYKISRIYSSPITRAMETAQPLAKQKGLPILPCDALTEVDYGDWAGKTFQELESLPAWQKVIRTPDRMQFPHGESTQEMIKRIQPFLQSLQIELTEEKFVVCFSHADVLALLLAICIGLPIANYPRFCLSPASISALRYTKSDWKIDFVNLVPGVVLPISGTDVKIS